jgi:protein O-mannosyl-transferase
MTSLNSNVVAAVLLTAVLAAVAVCYSPALSGPYVLDDEVNITRNDAIALTALDEPSLAAAAVASESSPLRRPLASLSFAINYYFAGSFEPSTPFKLTNLAIHLLNVILVYFLSRNLARLVTVDHPEREALDTLTGLLCATIWGLHPINVSTVLYVVQRMTALSALFVLGGLLAFVHGRSLFAKNKKRSLTFMYGGVIAGAALGITAKETAALLPFLALAIEFTLLRKREPHEKYPAALQLFYGLILLLPLLVGLLYIFTHPDFILKAYTARPFTLVERLLTETRVLWYYVRLIIVPDVREFGLFHDDIVTSTSILNPLTTLLAVIGIAVALGICFRGNKFPILAYAIAWFIAGHLLESTVIGLERAYEHRNYIPSIGIIFALSHGLADFFITRSRQPILRGAVAALLLLILGFTAHLTVARWIDLETLARETVRYHPESPRNNDFASLVSLNMGDLVSAEQFASRSALLAPTETGYRINLYMIATLIDAANKHHSEFIRKCRASVPALATVPCPLLSSSTIESLLRSGSVTAITLGALANLRVCVVDNINGCQSLEPIARSWFTAAADNPRLWNKVRESVHFNAALVYAHSADYAAAVAHVRKAKELAPNRLSYRIGEVDFLIRLGRREEALQALRELDALHYSKYEQTRNASVLRRLRESL